MFGPLTPENKPERLTPENRPERKESEWAWQPRPQDLSPGARRILETLRGPDPIKYLRGGDQNK